MSALPLDRSTRPGAARDQPGSGTPTKALRLPQACSAAGMAFWPTLRKVVVIAASVDLLYFVLFLGIGVPELAWPNVSSIALYATAYALILRRINMLAIALIWIEVV